LLVIFVLGVAAGYLGSQASRHSHFREAFKERGEGHFRERGFHHPLAGKKFDRLLEKRLRAVVDPTDEQREKLAPVLKRFEQKLQVLVQERHGRIKRVMDSLDIELEAVLTPEQMEKWRRRPHGAFKHRHGPDDSLHDSSARE
jgi:hypothetical protein